MGDVAPPELVTDQLPEQKPKRRYQLSIHRTVLLSTVILLIVVIAVASTIAVKHASAPTRALQQSPQTSVNPTPSQSPIAQVTVLDPKKLPLGDGKVSTSPQKGFVDACQTNFNSQKAGAMGNAYWIHGTTWDSTRKPTVRGTVNWPSATFTITTQGSTRVVSGNGLPVNEPTGVFPISRSDPAYASDRNPNSITPQQISFQLPLLPVLATQSACVPMGMIGVALDGVPIFNALDAGGRDAVAHEVQDTCNGHPQQQGIYHYHGPSDCMPHATENNQLVGYALDGFGIYSLYDANGKEITDADLDECHGTLSPVMWNGQMITIYHYVLTREYPYTVGCFRGTPVQTAQSGPRDGSTGQPGGQMQGGPNRLPPQ